MKQIKNWSLPISNYWLTNKNEVRKLLSIPFVLVDSLAEVEEVALFWKEVFKTVYPDFNKYTNDSINYHAYIFITRNRYGRITSSIRLTIDSPLGLPSKGYYPPEISDYRRCGYRLMEFGRMVNKEGGINQLKEYHKLVYQVAMLDKVDFIVMTLKQKDVRFYENLVGAFVLLKDMGIPVGGIYKLSCVIWDVKNTNLQFFRWVGLDIKLLESDYKGDGI